MGDPMVCTSRPTSQGGHGTAAPPSPLQLPGTRICAEAVSARVWGALGPFCGVNPNPSSPEGTGSQAPATPDPFGGSVQVFPGHMVLFVGLGQGDAVGWAERGRVPCPQSCGVPWFLLHGGDGVPLGCPDGFGVQPCRWCSRCSVCAHPVQGALPVGDPHPPSPPGRVGVAGARQRGWGQGRGGLCCHPPPHPPKLSHARGHGHCPFVPSICNTKGP